MSQPGLPPRTEEQLQEAGYFLRRMAETEGNEAFVPNVDAFLGATRAVKDVLKGEIAEHLRRSGKQDQRRRAMEGVEHAMKAGKEMDTLVAKRDVAHHEGRQLVEAEWVEIPAFPRSGDRGIEDFLRRRRLEQLRVRPAVRSRIAGPPGVQATEYACRWFFPEVRDRDAFTVCAQYLERVRAAAAECVARYMA